MLGPVDMRDGSERLPVALLLFGPRVDDIQQFIWIRCSALSSYDEDSECRFEGTITYDAHDNWVITGDFPEEIWVSLLQTLSGLTDAPVLRQRSAA